MIYVAWKMAERVSARRLARCVFVGIALAAWDLNLDPQMVRDGYWTWHAAGPAWLGVPLTNCAGWFGASSLMALAVSSLRRRPGRSVLLGTHVPFALYAWTFVVCAYTSVRWYGVSSPEIIATMGMGLVVCGYAWRMVRPMLAPAHRVSGSAPGAYTPRAPTRVWTRASLWRTPSEWVQ